MRILFVQKRYHSNQHCAMKGLLSHGHTVAYFTHNIGPSENYGALIPKQIPYSTVFLFIERMVYRLAKYKISRPNYGFPSLVEFYHDIKSFGPDVIIVETGRLYSQFATIIGKLLRKPVVMDTEKPMTTSVKNRRNNSPLRRCVTRLAIKPRVSFTPVSGVPFSEKPTRYGATYYIPLVVELSPVERLRSYRQDGTIKILSVAKYQDLAKKRHDLLIQAFDGLIKTSHQVSLTFVGSGKEGDPRLRYLKTMASEFNVEDRITFKMNVPNDRMNEIYADHDLFVLPSRREGYGYSVLEAMASGLPVIASNRAGASDCIDHGVNGYIFKSDDLNSLTSAIESIIKDHDTLEKMGQASREIVRSRYTPDVYHDRLMYLLKEEFGLSDAGHISKAEGFVRASG